MGKPTARKSKSNSIPPPLRAFAWNLGDRLTPRAKRQIALNVIERGRAWHWRQLPKGWFDLKFCLAHGQNWTKKALRDLFPEEG